MNGSSLWSTTSATDYGAAVRTVLGGLLSAVVLVVAVSDGARAGEQQASGIKEFFGAYVGRSISKNKDGLNKHDLDVTISRYDENGFTVAWTAAVREAEEKIKRRKYSVHFKSTKRPGVYSSGMRNNIFGHHVPLDPLAGDPYIWAALTKETLTVHTLHVIDGGGYEMQHHKRTLTKDGLRLRFERLRNGVQLELVTGSLEKASP